MCLSGGRRWRIRLVEYVMSVLGLDGCPGGLGARAVVQSMGLGSTIV